MLLPSLLMAGAEVDVRTKAGIGEKRPVDFAASIAEGRRSTRLAESTGARMEAEYSVDVRSGQLVVKIKQGGQLEVERCPIALIEDIYTVDDGEQCFPRHLMDMLTSEEKAGLCLIVWPAAGPGAEPESLYLIEASQWARDELLKCLIDQTMGAAKHQE